METGKTLLLAIDLTGTFAFALNGALTAMRVADVDIIGVLTLGIITAMGGGIVRDIIIDSLPPATFSDWRYLAVAAGGALLAFFLARWLTGLMGAINLLDAVGLSFFAVSGASKALALGLGPAQAVILGAVTAVGGGTLRDVLTQRVPNVLRSELYAIPALIAATIVVVTTVTGVYGLPFALLAAGACFAVRMIGVRYDLNAPKPRSRPGQ
ncbi:MAG: trimeric intracellular cation channel family protein [Intrasporangium sp.]|uniref:trimeric intracellular cation channel family protein n=1 Tax=Intrasporangium sp. TaxID=1925024 RepID=UPI003F7FC7FC